MHLNSSMLIHGLITDLFLALNKTPPFKCATVYLSIHLLKDIAICFQVFAAMNKTVLNISIQVLCRWNFLTPLDTYQGVLLLDIRVKVCLVLYKTTTLSSKEDVTIYIPANNE